MTQNLRSMTRQFSSPIALRSNIVMTLRGAGEIPSRVTNCLCCKRNTFWRSRSLNEARFWPSQRKLFLTHKQTFAKEFYACFGVNFYACLIKDGQKFSRKSQESIFSGVRDVATRGTGKTLKMEGGKSWERRRRRRRRSRRTQTSTAAENVFSPVLSRLWWTQDPFFSELEGRKCCWSCALKIPLHVWEWNQKYKL